MTAWPWPQDTALARARRVAQSYRAVLLDTDPTACRQLDEQMRAMGQRWVAPRTVTYGADDWLSAELVAEFAGVRLNTVYEWRARGLASIKTNEGIRFRFADVQAWVGGNRSG